MKTKTLFIITNPVEEDWTTIQNLIREYKLDDHNLSVGQFIVCKDQQTLLGFGRLKKHFDCDEISSLGVLTQHRNKSVGEIMVKELLKRSTKDIFIVTVIPEYFTRLGFETTSRYPASMIVKQNDCKDVCGCNSPAVMTFKK